MPALDSVNVLPPRLTPVAAEDEPASAAIDAPLVVAEMSNTPAPLLVTPDDVAMLPAVDSAKVPPLIVVAPI